VRDKVYIVAQSRLPFMPGAVPKESKGKGKEGKDGWVRHEKRMGYRLWGSMRRKEWEGWGSHWGSMRRKEWKGWGSLWGSMRREEWKGWGSLWGSMRRKEWKGCVQGESLEL